MFCTACGRPVDPSARSCPACGNSLVPPPGPVPRSEPAPLPSSRLLSVPRLVMVYQGGLGRVNFGFEDPSGASLGGTQGEMVFPLKYTVFDEGGQPVLILDAVRVRGLLFDFLVHDPNGQVLASVRQETSFMSRKYGVSVDGVPRMTLTTDALGYHFQLVEDGTGISLATGERTSGLRRSFVELSLSPARSWDHRIGVGTMLLAYYLCTRRTG
jgi:hypothetical protein